MPEARESAPIRVMIVDDSAVMRGFLRRMLEPGASISVVAAASNGQDALAQIAAARPDIVLLDIDMPVMDGLTALPQILKARPGVRVIMASSLTTRNASISLQALRLGASDYMPKPDRAQTMAGATAFSEELVAKVVGLARAARRPEVRASQTGMPVLAAPPRPVSRAGRVEIIAIGSSTGGPPALMKLFEDLGDVTQPILVTQHMPPTFTAMLAEHIGRVANRPTAEARDGEILTRGRIYVAPAGCHLTVHGREGAVRVRLSDAPPENFCRPAVDPMLRSLAGIYGPGVMAVILTGMGSDGAKGCEAVARAGGRFVVQDEATSVIWGMPGAAARTGLADAILPLNEIAPFLRQATRTRP